ncbi:polysaccharide deacetylase family protein [Actinomadura algeriensis]|uniref:Peptidoglycan/xylan/chitin deacetylase (PgdA/CDA1 family) n=1 Tax=Actinomadura algeriensis TaxID=1679523 RepID=A0ABR9JNE0_9ACTN|nr:polysaccharide deacetylase family protein [Actinomadura algeriensis]MBE1532072.1 peptidoglycan/xylan/chitin deacetylase (PgdA/CDA1 family) [Actinomadura algeriensis]
MVDDETTGTSRRRALWLFGAVAALALAADEVRAPNGYRTAEAEIVPATPAVNPAPPRARLRPASWTPGRLVALDEPVRELTRLSPPPPAKTIALTIDDGPHPEWTPKMLDLLAEHDVRATFFIIGEQVGDHRDLTRRIADAGHQICNHTMHHPLSLDGMSTKAVREEVVEAHDRIADATGVLPGFFRAPGGNWSDRVMDVIAEFGMLPIDWSIDPRDWARPGTRRVRDRLLEAGDGDILLCHDGGGDRSQTIKGLRKAIPELKKRGLTFATL